MATVTKQWSNGDALTLVTSEGGISVSSAENQTGVDREMTIRVQTTNSGTKVFKDVLIKQAKYEVVQDGYWVHKTTNAKTYFGADAAFISNGVMSRPSWIANAKEIRLCSGITEFETITSGGYTYTDVFAIDTGMGSNLVLEKLDFGNAQIGVVPTGLITPMDFNGANFIQGAFRELIFNANVVTVSPSAMSFYLSTSNVAITMMPGIAAIGRINPDNPSRFEPGIVDMASLGGAVKKFTIKTPSSNIAALTNLIANAGGTGISGIQGNYEIVAL